MKNVIFAVQNAATMFKRLLSVMLMAILLTAASCANRPTRAMRKAERMMAQQEAQAEKDYAQAKAAHYKRQAPKTKKMMRDDQRRARRLNRGFRRF